MKKSTGNMYSFITHTWNPVTGKCPYNCVYCYADKFKELPPLHLDKKILKENLGEDNFIFICSGCDLFHPAVPDEWISYVLLHTLKFPKNKYLLHTKNPARAAEWQDGVKDNYILCVTIESNNPALLKKYSNAPHLDRRIEGLVKWKYKKMITIEPIMEFDCVLFNLIKNINPIQVNIGANSLKVKRGQKIKLPEPSTANILRLIKEAEKYTKVCLKKNLKRLVPLVTDGSSIYIDLGRVSV